MKSWKNKLISGFSYVAGFLLFAFPVVDQWVKFRDWVLGLFMHSGKYGGGDKNFVDPVGFNHAFHQLIKDNNWVIYLLIGSLLLLFFLYKNETAKTKKIVLFGWLFFVFQFLFVSKHFAFHYIIPAIMLPPFVLLMQLDGLNKRLTISQVPPALWLLPVLIIGLNLHRFNKEQQWLKNHLAEKQATIDWIAEHPASYPTLHVTHYSYSPNIVAGLWHGLAVSGIYKPDYVPILDELYPDMYYIHYWSQQVFNWNERLSWNSIASNDTMVLYTNQLTPDRDQILSDSLSFYGFSDSLLYRNELLKNEVRLLTKTLTD